MKKKWFDAFFPLAVVLLFVAMILILAGGVR